MDKNIKKEIIGCLQNDKSIPAEYEEVLFPTTKKEYELKYAGKERKEVILNDTMSVPFQPVKYFGKAKEGDWANMLIFGDNLQALKHLLKLKNEGKLKNSDGSDGVKLVYIDPPFGTGEQYDAKGDVPAYSAKLQGTKFLEFLRKRLILLREILSDDGSIYVRIDYHFGHYLKILMDEIFGKNYFLNEIVINRTKKIFEGIKRFNTATDSVFFYTKNKNYLFNGYKKERLEQKWIQMHSPGIRWTNVPDDYIKFYSKSQLREKNNSFYSKGRVYEGKIIMPPEGRHWTFIQERLNQYVKEGRIRMDSKSGNMQYKTSPLEIVDSNWTDIPGYSFKFSYPTENSEQLLERIILSSSNKFDIVLDCFAGSGTTGAVAEKLGRKWIMVDCGKLAIYTMQKRLMNLKEEIGNKGKPLKPKPFILYHAGLYQDGKFLVKMEDKDYKDFVLELFGCQKRIHKINGLEMHGTLNNHSVMVFDKKHFLTHEFLDELHKNIGSFVKDNLYIIAPVGVVGFNEDYVTKGKIKYTILRVPNSIIEYIKEKNFTRLEQPRTSADINQTIDSVGFDFIYPPKVKVVYSQENPKDKLIDKEYIIEIKEFEPIQIGSKIVEFKDPKAEALAMVMIDLDYDGETFSLDKYYFGDEIAKNNFKIKFSEEIGEKIMVIYLDIFGNEKKEFLNKNDFLRK
ncbi:site-specific DNA-methyltransferase [archaeon AH-315-M20]|nr:site-specific DNA-methyltransferase [archaeon AH-315-M20]